VWGKKSGMGKYPSPFSSVCFDSIVTSHVDQIKLAAQEFACENYNTS
jgi:hypothetical protein